MGICGGCRKEELTYMEMENVKDQGEIFFVKIPMTKTKISREFVVTSGDIVGINLVEIVRKYIALRPNNTDHRRFFLGYRSGKCIKLPVGINTIGSMPKNIATFLKLPNAKDYTGHCFRRSSTSLLANSGADLLTVKRHGGWKSNTVAEGYIDSSVENKKQIAAKIVGERNMQMGASNSSHRGKFEINASSSELSSTGMNLLKCQDFVVNIHNYYK